MLKLVPFDFIQPSKLLLGLGPNEYVAVDEKGMVLGRGRNKEAILLTPGAHGYFNLKEMAPLDDAKDGPPPFEKAPWGSLGPVQNIPGQPLIEPVKVNRPDLIVVDEASKVTPEMFEVKLPPSQFEQLANSIKPDDAKVLNQETLEAAIKSVAPLVKKAKTKKAK